MKFFKWFAYIDEGSSEERMRAEYRQLPDRQLALIDPDGLTPLGKKCYEEEMARRRLGLDDGIVSPEQET